MRALFERVRGMVRPASCPVPAAPCPAAQRRRRLLRLWLPLVTFAVPTVVIAYGFVIPGSCIHGFNELTFGFATTVLGACISYVAGVRAALRS
jgi:ABC-type Fe3+ transport system permease subunit